MEKPSKTKLPSPQERLELILLGLARGRPVEALCQEAGVSRELFYRWMRRVRQGALQALEAKAPGPKRVKNTEQTARRIQRVQERMERLEREAAVLRKERDHLKAVSEAAQRIIRRQAWEEPKVPAKKNAMRTRRHAGPMLNSGSKSEPLGQRCDPLAQPGGFTAPPMDNGSGAPSGPDEPSGGLQNL